MMTKVEELIEYCNYVSEHGPENIKSMFDDMSYYLSRYNDTFKNMYFSLNDVEKERADKFHKKHVKGRYFGTIGGGMIYTFMPTGLGDIKGAETFTDKGERIHEDITDISQW